MSPGVQAFYERVVAPARGTVAALRGEGRGWILLSVAVGWLLVLGVRLVIPALLPRIRAAFALDYTVAGSLLTILLLTTAPLQFPSGVLTDRVGGRAVLFGSFLVAFLGVLLMTVAPAFAVFLLGVVLFGVGTGFYGTPRVTILSDVYPDRESTAIGFCSAAGNVGTSLLPAVAGWVAVGVGWRWGFAFTFPLVALTAVGLWRYVPSGAGGAAVETLSVRSALGTVLRAMTTPAVALATVLMTVMFFAYQGFTTFLPTYLVETKAVSEGVAATLLGLFFGIGVVFQVGGGTLGDRLNRRRVQIAAVGLTALALLGLPFASGLPAVVALVALASVQLGYWPIAFSYTVGVLPPEAESSGFGLLRSFYLLVGSVGSVFVGALADAGYFDEAFLLLGGAVALGAVLAVRLPNA